MDKKKNEIVKGSVVEITKSCAYVGQIGIILHRYPGDRMNLFAVKVSREVILFQDYDLEARE